MAPKLNLKIGLSGQFSLLYNARYILLGNTTPQDLLDGLQLVKEFIMFISVREGRENGVGVISSM